MEDKSIQFHYIYLPYRRDRSIFKYSLSNWILVARLYTAELFSFFFFFFYWTGPINVIVEKQQEREGFEPSIVFFYYTGFQDRSHQPLGHLSRGTTSILPPRIIPNYKHKAGSIPTIPVTYGDFSSSSRMEKKKKKRISLSSHTQISN